MSTVGGAISGAIRGVRPIASGRNGEYRPTALIFLTLLWFALAIAFGVLVTLIVTIIIEGQGQFTLRLFTEFPASSPDRAGARPAILGSIWVIGVTAVMTIPLGVAAAVHLEEFADKKNWFNKLV